MPRPSSPRLTRLQSTGLLGGAGAGMALGKTLGASWSGILTAPAGGWSGLAQCLVLGGAAWFWWRSGRRRPASLRPQLQALPGLSSWDGLRFAAAGPRSWRARRGAWRLELSRDGPSDLPWRLHLRRGDLPPGALPLTQGASLAALLTLSRRFSAQGGRFSSRAPLRGLHAMLDCDLEFPLPHGNRLTALAEGGFALQDGVGLHGISAAMADTLLMEGTIEAGKA